MSQWGATVVEKNISTLDINNVVTLVTKLTVVTVVTINRKKYVCKTLKQFISAIGII